MGLFFRAAKEFSLPDLLSELSFWEPTIREDGMAWTKPRIVEICVGLEINAYYPAEL
jgi:coenzyme PQQ precursor peptide PqqA